MNGADVVVRQEGDLLTTNVDGDLVGISVDKGVCYGFDAIATRVWELIETPRRFEALCAQLVAEFEVKEDECRKDVAAFLEGLSGEGLVSIRRGE